MAIFHQLPDSVLQLLAVFYLLLSEALPFVLPRKHLVWLYQSSWLWKGQLPAEKQGLAILFGTPSGLFSLLVVGLFIITFRKKCPSYYGYSFHGNSSIINPVVLFATHSLWDSCFHVIILRFRQGFLDCSHDFGNGLCGEDDPDSQGQP